MERKKEGEGVRGKKRARERERYIYDLMLQLLSDIVKLCEIRR